MEFNIKDFINKKIKNGVNISYSIDIRTVENFFKKLFGKKTDQQDEDKKDE